STIDHRPSTIDHRPSTIDHYTKNTKKNQQQNLVICLSLAGNKGFSVLMTDKLPDYHLIGDAQCFPLYLYETEENN
ncbi:type ISP restriction/modification enzyme, partial [Acinetobacter ursingii]